MIRQQQATKVLGYGFEKYEINLGKNCSDIRMYCAKKKSSDPEDFF